VGGRELKAEWVKACGDDADLAALTGVDEPIFCLGNCALGPAALVDGELMGCADVARLKAAVTQAQAVGEGA
jgi:formate dehydrogenase subunit gamma